MTISIISHSDCVLHEMGDHHPESPLRLSSIQDQLLASGLDIVLRHHDAPLATREQLCRVHDADYVDQVFLKSPKQGQAWLDPDTVMNPHTLTAALRAAGAAILGVDLVMNGQASAVFCSVRPPGHHAEHDKSMGFCIFNNIAVAAAHALEVYKLKRIAIVDFDVHHGNGTEDIFRDTEEILFCSTFQHPLYPDTGNKSTSKHVVNVPLPAGTDGAVFRDAVTSHWLPRLEQFQPELILISAGFDGHIEDGISDFKLHEQDFAWVTTEVKKIADKYAKGRIVSTLEGGYALHPLARSITAHIKALLG